MIISNVSQASQDAAAVAGGGAAAAAVTTVAAPILDQVEVCNDLAAFYTSLREEFSAECRRLAAIAATPIEDMRKLAMQNGQDVSLGVFWRIQLIVKSKAQTDYTEAFEYAQTLESCTHKTQLLRKLMECEDNARRAEVGEYAFKYAQDPQLKPEEKGYILAAVLSCGIVRD